MANEVEWPSDEVIEQVSPYQLVHAALSNAAQTAAAPEFRALVARSLGSADSHPSLMETYWTHYALPRRALAVLLLERAREQGTVAADADLDALIDMMAGAVIYRVLHLSPGGPAALLAELRAALDRACGEVAHW